ncbi:hypothetical protein [Mesorhizobium sp. CC13]|uniref:hypothetical protein n=1 Tax=Mesorhizobium sp. CC13 TaxID=3029194 RepID=UPI0032651773
MLDEFGLRQAEPEREQSVEDRHGHVVHQIDFASGGEGFACQRRDEVFDGTQLAARIRAYDRRDLSAEMAVMVALVGQRHVMQCGNAGVEIYRGAVRYLSVMVGKSDDLETIRPKYLRDEVLVENTDASQLFVETKRLHCSICISSFRVVMNFKHWLLPGMHFIPRSGFNLVAQACSRISCMSFHEFSGKLVFKCMKADDDGHAKPIPKLQAMR